MGFEKQPPKYRGPGIDVWINKDKEGKTYLTVQVLGKNGVRVPCYKYEPPVSGVVEQEEI